MQRARGWVCCLVVVCAAVAPAAAEESAVTPAPRIIVSHDELEATGRVTLGEALALLPVHGDADAHDGTQRIDLHALGARRTLVLINGRRTVTGGPGADSSVDLSTIPLAIVERVELVEAGGSTMYGSDAIGGVVNIITRGDFDGGAATIEAGAPDRGGLGYDASAIAGFGFAHRRVHLMFAAGLDHEDPILAADRGIAGGTPDAPASHYHARSEGRFQLAPAIAAFYEVSYVHRSSAQPVGSPRLDGLVVSRDSLYNPYGVDVFAARRGLDGLDGRSRQTADTVRGVLGIGGTIPDDARALPGWAWELAYSYGRSDITTTHEHEPVFSRLATAVGPSFLDAGGVPRCGTPAAPIAGCVPLNVFQVPITLDPATRAYLTTSGVSPGFDELRTVQATAHGTVVALPHHGALSAAVGADARREQGGITSDPMIAPGDPQPGASAVEPDTQDVIEGSGGLSLVPVRGVAWAELLELELAARASHDSTSGNDVTWQAGGVYRPIAGIALRGTYGTAFHAPSVGELNAARVEQPAAVEDPCDTKPPSVGDGTRTLSATAAARCRQEGVPADAAFGTGVQRVAAGGNADARAETATIVTAGVLVDPPQVPGLALAIDYWHIAIGDALQTRSVAAILANCYERGLNADCLFVHRDPARGEAIDFIDTPLDNTGAVSTSGVTVALGYDHALGGLGRLRAQLAAELVLSYDDRAIEGFIVAPLAGRPDVKASWVSAWTHPSGLGAGLTVRFVDGVSISQGELAQIADPARRWYNVDLRASYRLTTSAGQTTIAAGVTNLLDRDPGYLPNGGPAVVATYDPVGRLLYVRLSHQL